MKLRQTWSVAGLPLLVLLTGASIAAPVAIVAAPLAPVTPDSVLPLSNQEILTALGRERAARQQLARQLEAVRRSQDQHAERILQQQAKLVEQQAKLVELATALDRATHDVNRLVGNVVDTSGELDRRRAATARANQWLAVAVALAILAVLAGLGTVARRMSEVEAQLRALSAGSPEPRHEDVPHEAA